MAVLLENMLVCHKIITYLYFQETISLMRCSQDYFQTIKHVNGQIINRVSLILPRDSKIINVFQFYNLHQNEFWVRCIDKRKKKIEPELATIIKCKLNITTLSLNYIRTINTIGLKQLSHLHNLSSKKAELPILD